MTFTFAAKLQSDQMVENICQIVLPSTHFDFSCALLQGPLVGMNPVQIRATLDLYPSSRASPPGGVHHPEAPAGWLIQQLQHSPFIAQTNALPQLSHGGNPLTG